MAAVEAVVAAASAEDVEAAGGLTNTPRTVVTHMILSKTFKHSYFL